MGDVEWLPVTARERFVDKREIAALLGVHVGWVEKRCGPASVDRSFPSHLVGGARRFRVSEVLAWVERDVA